MMLEHLLRLTGDVSVVGTQEWLARNAVTVSLQWLARNAATRFGHFLCRIAMAGKIKNPLRRKLGAMDNGQRLTRTNGEEGGRHMARGP